MTEFNNKCFVISTYHILKSAAVKSKRPSIAAMASYFIIPLLMPPDFAYRGAYGSISAHRPVVVGRNRFRTCPVIDSQTWWQHSAGHHLSDSFGLGEGF
ncbi:MAG TPA: hypothetical protein VE842_09740 [Pyrinomonadaceae bacterium]|nr:hypothetical protein [Pyrinomonadaceae bacterium]